jgi:hypothetical protein
MNFLRIIKRTKDVIERNIGGGTLREDEEEYVRSYRTTIGN